MNNRYAHLTPGIPDHYFNRASGIPMTRSEIRALIISRLQLFPHALVYDVGAGSGSVAVECALGQGQVYAIEKNPRALELIAMNARLFQQTLKIISGEAPAALEHLPRPHRIFLGGSGGNLEAILETCHQKLLPQGRLVLTSVTLESAPWCYRFLQSRGYTLEALQLHGAILRQRKDTLMWEGNNPVTLVSGEKGEEHP